MILQALHDLYDRLANDQEYGLAEPGYSTQNVTFAVVLTPEGVCLGVADEQIDVTTHDAKGKSKSVRRPRPLKAPGQAKPTGQGINPCFLWDNTKYMLGYDPKDERPERTRQAFQAFRERHLSLEKAIDDLAFSAVCRFLEQWTPDQAVHHPSLEKLTTGFGVFRLAGEEGYVHQRPRIRAWWREQAAKSGEASGPTGMCLISGAYDRPLARLQEPRIKGILGAQRTGALLVSFNSSIYFSYGRDVEGGNKNNSRDPGFNAPISREAVFRYCSTLDELLNGPRRHKHRIPLAGDTVIFWTRDGSPIEESLADFFAGRSDDEEAAVEDRRDEVASDHLKTFFEALRGGGGSRSVLAEDYDNPFYILGLSPNVGRIAVRFWHQDTLGGFLERLRDHFRALEIVRPPKAREFPTIRMLLRETALQGKDENVAPLLGGAFMRALLTGSSYPDALAAAVIRRIRADRDDVRCPNRQINYLRAALLKAWLIRSPRWQGEIPVSLDITRPEPAYRLGRLFAALEKTQEEALPGLNATIRDRYYGAVSATPGVVMPRLLRTYQHHLSNLSVGGKVMREKLVQEIVNGLDVMPRTLSLEEQGVFAIGYYHQRQDFFTRKGAETTAAVTPRN